MQIKSILKFTIFTITMVMSRGHVPVNNSDVYITLDNHFDVGNQNNRRQNTETERHGAAEVMTEKVEVVSAASKDSEYLEDPGCTCPTPTSSNSEETQSHENVNKPEPLNTIINVTGVPEPPLSPKETKHYSESQHRPRETHSNHGVTEKEEDQVIFIPNEREKSREREDPYMHRPEKTLGDLFIKGRTLDDIMQNAGKVNVDMNDGKQDDLYFIAGKNLGTEGVDHEVAESKTSKKQKPKLVVKKVKCKSLHCSNTDRRSVCGGKLEGNKWRYRLFMNECFFNKVNCGFKYDANKYIQIENERCAKVGSQNTPKPNPFNPRPPKSLRATPDSHEELQETRRIFQSRRSLSLDLNGRYCSHFCPVSCPEEYAPECAMSSSGEKRVFLNHCKLDQHSCKYSTMWQDRPLADCVGKDAADVRSNRHFIAWMQNIGIVDSKGRFNRE